MMKTTRILVCGGRDFTDYRLLSDTLNRLCLERGWVYDTEYNMPDVLIISGMAKGADTLALEWAAVNWCQVEEYPADWEQYGRSAGPVRNVKMLKEGKPDIVVALPGGRGTAHMIKIAQAAGVEVIIVEGLPEVYSVQPVQPMVGL